MYTGHFGLDDGPFHGQAEGEAVYVGPQQAIVISRLRKALGAADTAVAVSGPVGAGKTTLVRRAIADVPGSKIVIPVDRIRLGPDDVLDLLLARFEVSRQPKGTIQRVAAFRRLLQERLSDDVRVFIVVEDAERVGMDALLELEALTANDVGEPVGANIVLMGDSELPGLLARPALARLRQRIRLRQVVCPFDADEVEGYMRHCLEAAGGVLEQIFEPGTARVVHRFSGGIARVVDNLCDAALVAAAEAGLATILPEFLQEVAENCGLESQVPDPEAVVDDPAETTAPDADPLIAGPIADPIDEAGDAIPADDSPTDCLAPAVAAIASTKPAPVDRPPVPAEEARRDDAPAQNEPAPRTSVHEPSAPDAAVDDEDRDASPVVSPRESWQARGGGPAVSGIDEGLPEPIARRQSSASGQERPAAALEPPAGDDEIPTLSNSSRVAVLPVRCMDERPSATEAVADRPAAIAGPVFDEEPTRETEALEAGAGDPAFDGDTGIRDVLADAGVEPAAESFAGITDVLAESFGPPVEDLPPAGHAAQAIVSSNEPMPARERVDATAQPASLPQRSLETAVSDEREPPVPEPRAVESVDAVAGIEPPGPETAGPEEQPGTADGEEAPADESASVELSFVPDASFSPGPAIARQSDGDVASEAARPSVEEEPVEEPAHAAGAATDGLAADRDAGDAGGPELDALQAAIQAADAWQASGAAGEPAGAVPEITLDAELEKRKASPTDQLDRWAEELSKAKSLEDISDILAETIFGSEEVEAISAEIRAKKAAERAAPAPPTAAPARPEVAPSRPKPAAARPAPSRPVPAAKRSPANRVRPAADGGIGMTLSQRIAMVNSLKGRNPSRPLKPMPGMSVAEIVLAEQPDEPEPKAAARAPAPIEAQIDTAMTQSRKVLSDADLARMASCADDEDDDDKKGSRGLFGFFRRTSKS